LQPCVTELVDYVERDFRKCFVGGRSRREMVDMDEGSHTDLDPRQPLASRAMTPSPPAGFSLTWFS
jgi:hypothetical protein